MVRGGGCRGTARTRYLSRKHARGDRTKNDEDVASAAKTRLRCEHGNILKNEI
jgi:hypothetical protein